MAGRIKDKLVRTKQKWAEEGRLLTGEAGDPATDRLPPGQREVQNWPVLDLGVHPEVAASDLELVVDGLVENPVTLDWDGLGELPQASRTVDVHCVTAWSRYENRFDGVATASLAELVRPRPEARFVLFEAYDGYTTNLAREVFEAPEALLATHWQGEPLTREHGAPVRVVVPSRYFWKSTKWVKRITYAAEDEPGFWEVRGYHNDGDPWREQRYAG